MKGQEWYQDDSVAQEYEDKRFSGGGRLIDRREKEAVLDAVGPVDGERVLEIACGTGRFTVMLAERGADVVGLDISDAMLTQGREKARRAGVADSIEFMRGDAGRLPFPDDHFDAVMAMRFFHLADTPEAYLTELARVAREVVFFDTFNDASLRVVYNWALPMGSRLYGGDEVRSLVADAGLTLTRADHDFVFPYGFYRKLPNAVAAPFRAVDTALGGTGVGRRLASVSYWTTAVDTAGETAGEAGTSDTGEATDGDGETEEPETTADADETAATARPTSADGGKSE
ncbi:class I SAM-dependent methyltransferase [Halobaculum sp. MBLA0147]|uniref:class I SAM-dependent methyltransferase n=1 Tax=Halobaculum sp. MBLA0147 TaxID=3079934 RepID=UPI0035241394